MCIVYTGYEVFTGLVRHQEQLKRITVLGIYSNLTTYGIKNCTIILTITEKENILHLLKTGCLKAYPTSRPFKSELPFSCLLTLLASDKI